LKRSIGLDIDPALSRPLNDSLIAIPRIEDAVIITNPPYLTNYSARRKGIYGEVARYFKGSDMNDLYKLALAKCLAANDYVVAIVPETFINSEFPKERLVSITVLEDNPFNDTENPVCIACFDGRVKRPPRISVYKNERYL
jgi:hypothetical protein